MLFIILQTGLASPDITTSVDPDNEKPDITNSESSSGEEEMHEVVDYL